MKKSFFVFALTSLICLQAVQIPAVRRHPPHPTIEAPWFTGPLLAPSALTIPVGHINVEPYLYFLANTGAYDKDWHRKKIPTLWTNYSQTIIQFGLTSWMDFQFSPTLFYNYRHGAGQWEIGDMPIGFDFQLYENIRPLDQWSPAISLSIREVLPIGKYQNLNPKKKRTDIGGLGSWQTIFAINWGNLFYIGNNRFITWRNFFSYTLPAPIHVKNFNVYGGSEGTRATVYPAQSFEIDTALEINLNRNWAFAIDFVGDWTRKVRVKGKTSLPITVPASAQFSLAPALEYNWSADIGIIFGSWFTIAGRSAPQFVSGIFAFNCYH